MKERKGGSCTCGVGGCRGQKQRRHGLVYDSIGDSEELRRMGPVHVAAHTIPLSELDYIN